MKDLSMTHRLTVKRIYEMPDAADGFRILVERLWARGLTKEKAAVDLWLKDIAPSPDLRKWYGHEPARWPEFQLRYRAELAANPEPVALLLEHLAQGPVTLLYSARDTERNSAQVLRKVLVEHLNDR
ncbi:MAG: DUF488 family protein [Sphingomonadales bacterium]|nr:DUF488 family protein [Sphingomonadales bacterium]